MYTDRFKACAFDIPDDFGHSLVDSFPPVCAILEGECTPFVGGGTRSGGPLCLQIVNGSLKSNKKISVWV